MPPPGSNVVRLPSSASLSWEDCRLLVENVVDYAIFMLDLGGHVVSWNAGARRLKGYTTDEIVGRHFSLFYTPEDRASGKPERILETVRREGRYEEEGWRVRKDGSLFWASVVISALRDESGTLRGFAKVTRDLSDRRKAEEELKGSEERLRLLVENIADYAIYMLDPNGIVTTWNLGAERMKGYKSSEVIGRHFSIFFPEQDVKAGKAERELAVARAHGRFEDEGWRVRKDGTRFWANAIITTLRNQQGVLVGFAKITRDLSFRRQAEETERRLLMEQTAREVAEQGERRLRESEERYRALSRRLEIVLEGVADGITVQDRTGRVVFANSAAARLCGFASADELVNTPPEQVVARFEVLDVDGHPFSSDKLPGRRVLAGEPTANALLHVRERETGQDWWALVRASGVTGTDGEPDLAVNIWHDVTWERRQAQQARCLADATAALGASLDYDEMLQTLARVIVPELADWCSIYLLEDGELRNVAALHTDPAKVETAKRYQQQFPPERTQARGVWNVVKSGVSELYEEISDATLVAAVQNPEQLEILRGIGMKSALLVPISVRGKPIGVLSLISAESGRRYDPSHVELAEELGRRAGVALENAQLYKAAQDSAKTAEEASRAKDEFLATVSHELRTPLSAILGWSTLLKDRSTDPAVAKPIEVIYRNAQAQVKIIDDILDVSRVITGKFRLDARPADLVSIAREAIEVVRPSAVAKKIDIEFRPSAEFCLLVADPERLQQVIWNLLSNAVKFTDTGGTIRVSVRQERSSVVLRVSDTGIGMDPSFLPFVFDRFRQADSSTTRRVGGLGLGLALVRHIVELHGGRVEAASEGLGKGATFTITLPVRALLPAAPEQPIAPRPRPARSAPALSGVRVLVVDDEPDARNLIATVLSDAGAEVETAPSAAAGFEALQRFRPNVVVSDIGMPDEDGLAFMRRVRALAPYEGGRIPSLALTAFASEDDRTRAIEAGYTTHIGKPVNPDALASAVANLAAVTLGRDQSERRPRV